VLGVAGAREPYPAHWEADVVLRDGATMHIRPIRPEDADALQRFHVRQSPQSTYFRFFAPKERLTEEDLARLTTVDHRDRVALVLVSGGEIRAVGRYDRVEGGAEAEVAFNVADELQGRGLGSVLLEHLAAAARERGVRRFVADVLPGNARMIHVFRDAGYDVTQAYEDGVLSVAFAIDPTERSLAVMAEREQHAEALSMRALLDARTVVVVAEGRADGRAGVHAARALLAGGYRGTVHLVGEAAAACHAGEAAAGNGAAASHRHADLASVPGPVDLAVVAAPAGRVPGLARRLGSLGAHGIVVLPGGPAPAGEEGARWQAGVVRAARDAGMRLIGPESFGVVATGESGRLNVTPWKDLPPPGGLGVFCQSAAAAAALLADVRRRGVGLAGFVSAGHRADVSGNDTMQYWIDDPATRVACVYLESIGNPRKFTRVARRLSARIPVVAVVSGQTGQAVPPGHRVRTSREPRRVLEELLRQAAVIRAGTTRQALDVAMLLEAQALPRGDRLAVLTNSGSLASLVAEVARAQGLAVAGEPRFLPAQAGAADFAAALDGLAGRQDWDALVVAYVPILGERDPGVGVEIARAAARTGRTTLACVLGLEGLTEELSLADRRVPAFGTVEDAVQALAAAVRYARWRQADHGRPARLPGTDPRAARALLERLAGDVPEGSSRALDAAAVAALLRCYGVEVWPSRLARTADDVVAAARELGWPVAVKSAGERFRHRLDLGGVRLDLAGAEDVRVAVRDLAELGGEAYEVQRMAPRGVACVVRTHEDDLYGPVVSFGLAGDAVDLLGDVAYRIPPLTDVDVREMVRSVRAAPRLLGHAGAPVVDVPALEDLLARVAALADDLPALARLTLEPVVVAERGARVLGARADVARPSRPSAARRVLPG
jgi:acyl-CoA synthetase (NDP forming)/GNAT superfamily N-acetyltransferase